MGASRGAQAHVHRVVCTARAMDSKTVSVAFWWGVTVIAFVGFAGMGIVGLKDTIRMEQHALVKVERGPDGPEHSPGVAQGHIAAAIKNGAAGKTKLSQKTISLKTDSKKNAVSHHSSSKSAVGKVESKVAITDPRYSLLKESGIPLSPERAGMVLQGLTKDLSKRARVQAEHDVQ